MRKTHSSKVVALIGGAALSVAVAGTAYAYWTTSGSGSGSTTTTTGSINELGFTTDPIAALFPGDAAKTVAVSVKNNSANDQDAYVTQVKAYITVEKPAGTPAVGCDASDFLLSNTAGPLAVAPGTAGTAINLTWTAQELQNDTAADATGQIQFNDKATNQDACKDVVVKLNYLAS